MATKGGRNMQDLYDICILINSHNIYSKTNQMHRVSNLFYFGTTLQVSDGLSVHHRESKTVHTASYHIGPMVAC